MKILVFGGNGFIGQVLVNQLVKLGNDVTCFVREGSDVDYLTNLKVTLFYGDINNETLVKTAILNQEVIYDLIGIGSNSFLSKKAYSAYKKTNVEGTRNILEGCIDKHIKKIVYFSSVAVMGLIKGVADETNSCNPVTPYQKSKYEAEQLISEYRQKHDLPIVIIRPTMVYGPRDNNSEIFRIAKFVKYHFFPLIGNGNNHIPLVHVKDVVNGAILAEKNGKNGEVYIITNKTLYSLKELVNIISNLSNKRVFMLRIPILLLKIIALFVEIPIKLFNLKLPLTRKRIESMTSDRIFNIKKAETELKYKQTISLEEGLKETILWYKNKGKL